MEDRGVRTTLILNSLLSGGVAGMAAKTSVAPLERIKILFQAQSFHYQNMGVVKGLRRAVEKESFMSLYKGNGAHMVRVFPYASIQFTSYEMYKELFNSKNSHIGKFMSGSFAGLTAVAFTYPLDMIRSRLSFQISGQHIYSGMFDCGRQIFKTEGGVRGLYCGFVPTLSRMVPYGGVTFYCFESFKYICMTYFPRYTTTTPYNNSVSLNRDENSTSVVLAIPFKLLCGGAAGAVGQTFSYPLDVARRRMQLANMNESTKKFGVSMLETLRLIYKETGIRNGLFRGLSTNYIRAIPMTAVSFSTYEFMKQLLHMDTAISVKIG